MSMAEPLRVALIVEAAADARTVATLIDKVLLGDEYCPSWLNSETLPYAREYAGLASTPTDDHAPRHTTWTTVKTSRLRVSGHGGVGEGKSPYFAAARRAIQLGALRKPIPHVVVLAVDADSQSDRREGFGEAKAAAEPAPFAIVLGVANPKREAWILNAFEPTDMRDKAAQVKLAKQLGLDPCADAHRLRGSRGQPRDIKRVLAGLLGCEGDSQALAEREREILDRAALGRLHERGKKTGLAKFLDDAQQIAERLEGGQ